MVGSLVVGRMFPVCACGLNASFAVLSRACRFSIHGHSVEEKLSVLADRNSVIAISAYTSFILMSAVVRVDK